MIIAFITIKTVFAVILAIGSVCLIMWDARDTYITSQHAKREQDKSKQKIKHLESELDRHDIGSKLAKFLIHIKPSLNKEILQGSRDISFTFNAYQVEQFKILHKDTGSHRYIFWSGSFGNIRIVGSQQEIGIEMEIMEPLAERIKRDHVR